MVKPMNKDLFGIKEKNPPYSPAGIKDGIIQIQINLENWEKYETGDGYDKYFTYYKCSRGGRDWYHRETKPEWEDKITSDIMHLPLNKLEEKLTQ